MPKTAPNGKAGRVMEQDTTAWMAKKLVEVPPMALLQQVYGPTPEDVLLPDYFPMGEKGRKRIYPLYRGIELTFLEYLAEKTVCRHGPEDSILEISYCRAGRSGWQMRDGRVIYLGPGDCAVHTRALCSASTMTFPNGCYEGLSLCVELLPLEESPPEILREAGVSGEVLRQKFCQDGSVAFFPGNERTAPIFSGFYDIPDALRLPYFKLKAQELLLYLLHVDLRRGMGGRPYSVGQIETIQQVHRLLTENLNRRYTIDDLSRRFLMNPSTLKEVFKAVYGNSIAAHIKEHRMEHAAALLRETGAPTREIAAAVGYESQSKFAAEFRKTFQVTPLEYRKLHLDMPRS